MNKNYILGISFLLLLGALPLISFGTQQDNPTLWWVGVGLVVVGGLIPPVARFVVPEDDEEEAKSDESGEKDESESQPASDEPEGDETEPEPEPVDRPHLEQDDPDAGTERRRPRPHQD
jgi:hypothetical protein